MGGLISKACVQGKTSANTWPHLRNVSCYVNASKPGTWLTPVIQATWDVEIGG
jgi:hypothetical protein